MEKFDIIFMGGGVGGSYGVTNLIKKLNKSNNKKKINIAIIDKNIKNIPGGVPYSKNLSSNGFYLPSGLGIKDSEIKYVAKNLLKILS